MVPGRLRDGVPRIILVLLVSAGTTPRGVSLSFNHTHQSAARARSSVRGGGEFVSRLLFLGVGHQELCHHVRTGFNEL